MIFRRNNSLTSFDNAAVRHPVHDQKQFCKKLLIGTVLILSGFSFANTADAAKPVKIVVFPTIRRQIDGVSALNRKAYFSMCDQGTNFDRRVQSAQRMAYLLGELNISFGRSLGPIRGVVRNSNFVREDSQRPGFVDLEHLRKQSALRRNQPNSAFARFVGGRLDVAAHGARNAFPDYMGAYTTPAATKNTDHASHLPDNLEAAAELSAAVMKHYYTDFDRPRYYEPINEPHWSYTSDQKLADWHLKTKESVQAEELDLKVGGPCNSVAYFYRKDYKAFDGLKNFIRNTNCDLDFYSFHAYDYLRWKGDRLAGRITSGLPLEGMLDLVQTHTINEYGKQVDIVISEHGGYISGEPNETEVGDLLAAKYFPEGEGFEHIMEKRSIANHVLVSAAIANTMAFLEHPHVVKKAVPFLLLESMGWDPKYYATLYVAHDFTDRNRWVESRVLDFFKFFRDLKGDRVAIAGGDPDLQTRAFVSKNQLMVVINNLSNVAHTTEIELPDPQSVTLRRYGRGKDYRPYLLEEEVEALEPLEIAGREAILLVAQYKEEIPAKQTVNEVPCYGNAIAIQSTETKPARFLVEVPNFDQAAYATLRIGVARPTNTNPSLQVKVNGKVVEIPAEDAAARYDDGEQEYASTKIINLNRKLLREKNRVEISFPDDQGGTIGSVVIRAAIKGEGWGR